ncbi:MULTISPECIES: NupC/NupG family nucleoside CNT transporter [Leptolyngbya]|jgi:CNT family concentrative nucleoside transporter|uniref:Nucleoside permease n=2 Tax=Leptolyngbya TaxID=47251 RepID=A0A1Z4JEW6_LEPBY|nr:MULTISPECIES: nucleoside transporter C-terminal domain-containing protein [Leptolyngbya]BAY55203.1 nucleoside permease [Leptolyngbya boryana NIES-2135]MBN8561766.1 nucleoside:proton symporter [Leptolyngbya sp. UWPOB_LEPTO1]MCY6491420.1 nucleoside:proton symporter [Leptolyngbya sp. GGD]ULP32107.1 nucleoside:proton symporter [Leptolyngbya boryana IU 594]BAS58470.1 nucleoside permease [Leptolyngbya boryana IAM M-101]
MSWLNLVSFAGIFILCGIAWIGSENRRVIPWKVILWGIALQLILGLLVFSFPVTRAVVTVISNSVNAILDATEAGARFLFGSLLVPDVSTPGPILAGRWIARAITPAYVPVAGDRLSPDNLNLGYVFAFRALPSVIFFSALMSLLYHLRVIQPIVNFFAKIFHRLLNLSGAEALSGATNIFVGIESALVIRPYLANMTRSELCAILTCCYGSIASTVLALYAGLLRPTFPNITGHLVSASFMAIPACFVVSKLLVPETETPKTIAALPKEEEPEESTSSAMESVIAGALDGVKLAIAIAALLVAVLGLVAIVNLFFANLGGLAESNNLTIRRIGIIFQIVTLQNIVGALFVPLTAITGVSANWNEIWETSVLIGRRLLETEVPAYQQLGVLASQGRISDRALVITSYCLCGFAHLPSVGIFVGGFSSLIPSRRKELASVGWKALWAATLATLMIGCVAGVFYLGNPSVLRG